MSRCFSGRTARRLDSVRRQLAAEPSLPFSRLLDAELVAEALRASGVTFRDRLYPPWVTLWIFLSQVLDPMQCCLQAVLRFAAWRQATGQGPCSTNTGGYCQARQRLPEGMAGQLARGVGHRLHRREAPRSWRWKGRSVKIADGTTVTMPDTPEN
ncbi:transposase domain-containing protein [Zavarzinella formosa]|uniref:transposase domain-containing protein n=1 Tax=Zavarzinella formosa TaxID=360055 RepID=UPI0002EB7056|nr:transposase domain-containing protein [Zavarzinella formosa]